VPVWPVVECCVAVAVLALVEWLFCLARLLAAGCVEYLFHFGLSRVLCWPWWSGGSASFE